jgi:hypothetical protein
MRAWAFIGLAFALAAAPAYAAEPAWWTQKKRECGLSPSLAYNTWAAQGYPCGGAVQPVQDPRTTLRNRVSALVSANSDLLDSSALARTNVWDDDAFAGLVAGMREDLWRAYLGYDARATRARSVVNYYAPHLEDLENYARTLNAARADSVPQSEVDAHDRAQAAEAAAQGELDRLKQEDSRERLLAMVSAGMWEDERNQTLAMVRARFPKATGLPAPTNADGLDTADDRMHVPAGPFHEPYVGPEPTTRMPPLLGVIAPEWAPDSLDIRQAAPVPEPAPATIQDQVSDLERVAGLARAAKTRAAQAQADLAQMEDRYRSYYKIAEKGQEARAAMESDRYLLDQRTLWLVKAQRQADVQIRNELWRRVYATSKALVWQAYVGKVAPEALRLMSHETPIEKAKKYKELLGQIRTLDGDFELFSTQAARILAQGSPGEAQHLLDGLWGTAHADGVETMKKALDAAGAPDALAAAWIRLIGDPEP